MCTTLRANMSLVLGVLAYLVVPIQVLSQDLDSKTITTIEYHSENILDHEVESRENVLLYTGVNHVELFKRLNYTYEKRLVEERGVGYVTHGEPKEIYNVLLAVHTTTTGAKKSFMKMVQHISIPTKIEENAIGSEFVMTGIRGDGGAIIVREGNICISFGWRGEAATARATAETVVDLIQGDRSVAPIGVFGDSVKLNNPKARVRNADRSDGLYILPAEFSGGKDPNSLLLGASSRTDRFYAVSRDEDDGSILIDLRGKSKPETLQLFIATEENVITIETIELEEIADMP